MSMIQLVSSRQCREEFNIGVDGLRMIQKDNGRATTQFEYLDNYEQRHKKSLIFVLFSNLRNAWMSVGKGIENDLDVMKKDGIAT